MRRSLDTLYLASGVLSAAFLAMTCGVVLLQVGCNLVGILAESLLGLEVSVVIPSYADFAGYFFASSVFFGIGYAHRTDSHIRVALLLEHVSGRLRRTFEVSCLAIAALLSGSLSYHALGMVSSSLQFGDVSVGLVAVPLWIPQMSMACGSLVLTIAVADDLLTAIERLVLHGGSDASSAAAACADDEGGRRGAAGVTTF